MNKLLFFCLALVALQLASVDAFQSIRMADIKFIDLYKGRPTVGYKPIEQQQCVNTIASLCGYYRPNYVRCYNQGQSGPTNWAWACQAELRSGISFDRLQVSCETFPGTHPLDNVVILGSCGLIYSLRRTF